MESINFVGSLINLKLFVFFIVSELTDVSFHSIFLVQYFVKSSPGSFKGIFLLGNSSVFM